MHKSPITSLMELQKNITRLSPAINNIEKLTIASRIYADNIGVYKSTPILKKTTLAELAEATKTSNELRESLSVLGQRYTLMEKSYSNAIRPIAQQVSEFGRQLEASGISYSLLQLQENYQKIRGSFNPNILQFQSTLYEIQEAFSRPEFQNLKFNPDGSVTTDTDSFSKEEVEESVIQAAQNLNENNVPERITQKMSRADILQIIAFLITLFLAIPHLSSTLEFYENAITPAVNHVKSKAQLVRNIQRNPEIYYEGLNLESPYIVLCKFTITTELSIRANPSTKSKRIGILFFGDAVIVLRKKRNWTLIEPLDENKKHLRGWVFTRYLKNIIPKNNRGKKL